MKRYSNMYYSEDGIRDALSIGAKRVMSRTFPSDNFIPSKPKDMRDARLHQGRVIIIGGYDNVNSRYIVTDVSGIKVFDVIASIQK